MNRRKQEPRNLNRKSPRKNEGDYTTLATGTFLTTISLFLMVVGYGD